MLKIKELPLQQDDLIGADELSGLIKSIGKHTSAYPIRPVFLGDQPYLLGCPFFELNFKKDMRQFIPVGQYRSMSKAFRKIKDKGSMITRLKSEYRAIVKALLELGIAFRIVDLERGDKEIGRWLRSKDCLSLELPYEQIIHWQIFPRDMCVYIRAVNALLVHSALFKVPSTYLKGCKIIHTTWGEGGRLLLSGDRMLLGQSPEHREKIQESRVISELKNMGMKAAFVPHALFYGLSPLGRKSFVFHHSHIDLIGSLLMDKEGAFHLIMDPAYRTGTLISPFSIRDSLDLVRNNCEKIEIEIHTPEKPLAVPLATSMVQFEDGSVLATKGDDDVLRIVEDIVGSGNIYVTNTPIIQYPMFGGAGLHCLITESPEPLISASGSDEAFLHVDKK